MPVEGVLYPVNLVVTGRRCVVIGGGAVAARKVGGLLAAGAVVTVIGTRVGSEIRSLASEWVERPYRPGDLEGAWLAIAATDDPIVNRLVHAEGEKARIWVNAADDPPACSFTLPAVVRQGPVMVTVSTGGYSPALATWLKGHIAGELGPEYAELAQMLGGARAQLQAEGRSTEAVDWRRVLDWSMLALIRAGDTAQARERLQACLS